MSKRGRPRTFGGKMQPTIGVRAPEGLADAIFIVAQRHNTDVSAMTRAFWMRVVRREGISLSENRQPDEKDALLLT